MSATTTSPLLTRAQQIANSFTLPPSLANTATAHFVSHLTTALANPSSPTQLPSFITHHPTGTETGTFLSLDLGGTNCRVSSVHLHGNGTYTLRHASHVVPRSAMVATSVTPLFSFLATCIETFLITEQLTPKDGKLPLGFVFSFTVKQHGLARGTLLQWDKGWEITDAIGRDPCETLQEEVDAVDLPVSVCALANDGVGTLLARAYAGPLGLHPLIGAIFGTGTNAAYVERRDQVIKLPAGESDDEIMLMNTEWGAAFDDGAELLQTTELDSRLDHESSNPGQQILEKCVGGLYLGELFRLAITTLVSESLLPWTVQASSPLCQQNSIDSEILSILASHAAPKGTVARFIRENWGVEVTAEEVHALAVISRAIAQRVGRIAGVAVAGIMVRTGRGVAEGTEAGFRRANELEMGILGDKKGRGSDGGVGGKVGCGAFLGGWKRWSAGVLGLRSGNSMSGAGAGAGGKEPAGKTVDIGIDGSLIEFYPFLKKI